ncbi:MAG: beta-galactosidase, partial [Lentisphaeria bacterium]|nr:beta-galactosidase [Lentisphaeria bacterium]
MKPFYFIKRLGLNISLAISFFAFDGLADPKAIHSEVKPYKGRPTLHINGKPHHGLIFYSPGFRGRKMRYGHEAIAAGVKILSFAMYLKESVQEDGTINFDSIDERFEEAATAYPEAQFMLRVEVEPPPWWRKKNMDQVITMRRSKNKIEHARVAFSSTSWRKLMLPVLAAYIKRTEKHYGHRVIGYQFSAGASAEWGYSWTGLPGDFSKAQEQAFQKWLKKYYANDQAKLRKAWADNKAEFATASVPVDRRGHSSMRSILDPVRDRRIIDYQKFHAEVVTNAIADFARSCKKTLADLGRKKVCGTFYGYWTQYGNAGHHGLSRLLRNPDIDLICSPYAYFMRGPGQQFISQAPLSSVALHGKLHYTEDDTRTFIVGANDPAHCADRAETLWVLRRNLMGSLTTGGTLWWMDLVGGGWYSDRKILQDLTRMMAMAEAQIKRRQTSVAQIAVVISESSTPYLAPRNSPLPAAIRLQLARLGAIGAPYELYLASDLEKMFTDQKLRKRLRMIIFIGCTNVSSSQRKVIREQAKADNRTLLWIGASGLVTDTAVSPEAMSELMGIKVKAAKQTGRIRVRLSDKNKRIIYGLDADDDPVLMGADPKAEVLGLLADEKGQDRAGEPGLLHRRYKNWRAYWSAAPGLPTAFLRDMAREAGVHIYTEGNEQIFATREIVSLHASAGGRSMIHFPESVTIDDAFSGQRLAVGVRRYDVDTWRGETLAFKLSYEKAAVKKSVRKTLKQVFLVSNLNDLAAEKKWNAGSMTRMVGQTNNSGITAHILFVNPGPVPLYKNQVYPMTKHVQWWQGLGAKDPVLVPEKSFVEFLRKGGDPIGDFIKACRDSKISPWIEFPMNVKVHGLGKGAVPAESNFLKTAQFNKEHPESFLSPSKSEPAKQVGNWNKALIRQRALRLITDLIAHQPDGLLLDFSSFGPYFLKEVSLPSRSALVTDFVQAVKKELVKQGEGSKPCRLAVRVPAWLARHPGRGVDLWALSKIGVDTVFLAHSKGLAQNNDMRRIRQLLPNVEIIHELHGVALDKDPLFSGHNRSTVIPATATQLATTAHLAYGHGLDGVALRQLPWKQQDIPKKLMKDLSRPEKIATWPQHYVLSPTTSPPGLIRRQVPRTLKSNWKTEFMFDLHKPASGWKRDAELRMLAEP